MDELFQEPEHPDARRRQPLAARMRPRSLDEIAGQQHILGPGKLLRRAIEADRLDSLILYGPPGCGKTTLAEVIALSTRRDFQRVSGITGNVAELRRILDPARQRVLIDMHINLGLFRLSQFKRMLAAIGQQNYAVAAQEMRASKWAGQVGRRAVTLAAMMADGEA